MAKTKRIKYHTDQECLVLPAEGLFINGVHRIVHLVFPLPDAEPVLARKSHERGD